MNRKSLTGALGAAALIGAAATGLASPASAAITYTFTADFETSIFDPPNASFKVSVPDFITSDQTFAAPQAACGDRFITCEGVSFVTDFSGFDVITINFGTSFGDQQQFYDFSPDAFGAPGVYTTNGPNNGTLTTALPEPSSWALLILGVGGIGVTLRQAKRKPASGATAT